MKKYNTYYLTCLTCIFLCSISANAETSILGTWALEGEYCEGNEKNMKMPDWLSEFIVNFNKDRSVFVNEINDECTNEHTFNYRVNPDQTSLALDEKNTSLTNSSCLSLSIGINIQSFRNWVGIAIDSYSLTSFEMQLSKDTLLLLEWDSAESNKCPSHLRLVSRFKKVDI